MLSGGPQLITLALKGWTQKQKPCGKKDHGDMYCEKDSSPATAGVEEEGTMCRKRECPGKATTARSRN